MEFCFCCAAVLECQESCSPCRLFHKKDLSCLIVAGLQLDSIERTIQEGNNHLHVDSLDLVGIMASR